MPKNGKTEPLLDADLRNIRTKKRRLSRRKAIA